MRNIVLIGMPGSGKSTIGVILAKSLLMDFSDTDLMIQKHHSSSLCDIIASCGINGFLEIENRVIAEADFSNCVVATGGSAVYGAYAMKRLKENGIIIYLDVKPAELERRISNIHTRGIAMKDGTSLAELYSERYPIYKNYADITIDCTDLTPEQCVDEITKHIL